MALAKPRQESKIGLQLSAFIEDGFSFSLSWPFLSVTGDRKEGHATARVARQYLGSVGKIDNGSSNCREPMGSATDRCM